MIDSAQRFVLATVPVIDAIAVGVSALKRLEALFTRHPSIMRKKIARYAREIK